VCDPINPVVNPIPRLIIVATYARQYIRNKTSIDKDILIEHKAESRKIGGKNELPRTKKLSNFFSEAGIG
jgi:hypothetical protein